MPLRLNGAIAYVKYIRALRRLLANTDRINDLFASSQQIREATDNLADRMIDKASVDRLQKSVERLANGLQCVAEAIANQAMANAAGSENHSDRGPAHETDDEPIEAALAALSEFMRNEETAARAFDAVLDFIRPHHRGSFWGDRLLTLDKSAGFRDDPAFRRAIATSNSSTGMNQYASPDGITWRFHTVVWAARQALTVPGDFVECGVYEGDMSWVLTEMVDLPAAGRRLHLFDTFAGFSPKYSSPDDIYNQPGFFEFADRDYKRPKIYEHVLRRFAAKPYVLVRKGVVPESLIDAPETIAYLHLDMNSPGPERAALDVLYDRISPGGTIVFDDYGWVPFKKQKEAADGFINGRGHFIVELPTGQGLAIKPAR